MTDNLALFARITKVDEEKRLVYGRATQEWEDSSAEIFDYETSKPYFEKWSADVQRASKGKSMGNVRSMHSTVAAGKVTGIDFNDTEKAIDVVVKVVDDNEWQKVCEGVHTGFSIGGKYMKKWKDSELVRYTAKPTEISLVDRPCVPTAEFFELIKLDGTVEKVKFKARPRKVFADTVNNRFPLSSADHVRAAWFYVNSESAKNVYDEVALGDILARVRDAWIDQVDEEGPPVKLEKREAQDLIKGLKALAEFTTMVNALNRFASCLDKELEIEADDSPLPAKLHDLIHQLLDFLVQLALEETSEIVSGMDDKDRGYYESGYWVAKTGARNNRSDSNRIQRMHDLSKDLGAMCGEPKKLEESNMANEDKGTEQSVDLAKVLTAVEGVSTKLDDLTKASENLVKSHDTLSQVSGGLVTKVEDLLTRVKALEDQPLPAKGALRVVGKSDESEIGEGVSKELPPITGPTGDANEAATSIRKIHSGGGRPFVQSGR